MIESLRSQIARKTILFTSFLTILTLLGVLFLFSWLNSQHRERIISEKANHELEAIQVIINDSYTIGDFIGLRKYLDTFSTLNSWEFGELRDIQGTILWSLGNRDVIPDHRRVYSIQVRTGTGGALGQLTVLKNQSKEFRIWDEQLVLSVSGLLAIALIILGLQASTLIKILRPVSDLAAEIQNEASRLQIKLSSELGEDEIFIIKKWFSEVAQSWHDEKEKAARESKFKAIGSLAAQVAHDIRSPLSALNMVASTLIEVSEDKRLIIRNATARINDIANMLLQKGKDIASTKPKTGAELQQAPIMLSSLVDSVISEKRVQFREKLNINLEVDLTKGYGLFSRIDGLALSRAISNIVNNSVEALVDGKGHIQVNLDDNIDQKVITIRIKDNGKGIPPEIINRIGTKGLSSKSLDSESGSGLGVFHARKTIQDAGGTFGIYSKVNVGTTVEMVLPKCDSPSWFLDKLVVPINGKFVSVDDDQTIHQLWGRRLSNSLADRPKVDHLTFTSLVGFKRWYLEDYSPDITFVIDQEFIGQNGSGLETIEKLNLGKNAVLVTSRAEELEIQMKAKELSVKIIPKGLAALVPIEIK